jgi:hypothetical protein
MSAFENAKVGEEFFRASVEREKMCEEHLPGSIKSNFLRNIGYGDQESVRPAACCRSYVG